MIRKGIGILMLLIPAVVPVNGSAAENTATAANDVTRIGVVHDDTLFVDRGKILLSARQGNEMLAASQAMQDAAAADAQGAWRGFLPQMQLGEFFLRSDDALSSFGFRLQNRAVNPQTDFGPVGLNYPGETNQRITRLQLLQPLFNGGMGLFGKQAANAASDAASLDHQRAGQTVALKAIEAYEGLALAQAYERVMKAAVASAEGHVGQAQSMVDNEMATEADLLQAKVYLSGLQQRFIEVQNMVAVAGQYIKLLTAVDTDLPLAVARDLEVEPVTPPPAQFDPAGSRSRADIAARRKQADAAGKMVGVARGAMLPHVNLGVQKDYYSQDKIFGNDADSWTLGVYATWDVFKGLQNISALKKARAQERAARYMADFETRQAGVQATEAWLNLAAAHDKVAVAREAVTSAREGLRIVTNQYREGLVSMVDLLDTQAAANMAEGNLVQALHDYQVGLARLEYMAAVPVGADVLDRRDSNANPEQDR
ncbi:hypothetical protein CO151_03080 [bacterium CG_4_9_14_3_um_filter_65_15]|nr:MAG: hypothetical protein CO151_03080 [bacterium CG_4_9_14_3_um_filter_65_15]